MAGGAFVSLVVMISEVLYAELHLYWERKRLKSGTYYKFDKHYCARVRQVLNSGSIMIQVRGHTFTLWLYILTEIK